MMSRFPYKSRGIFRYGLSAVSYKAENLLIALLRASDIPARYVHGVMETEAAQFQNWMGNFSHVSAAMQHASAGGIPVGANTQNNATIDRVSFEHVWVEAAIDYIPSGGLYNNEADTWVLRSSHRIRLYCGGAVIGPAGRSPSLNRTTIRLRRSTGVTRSRAASRRAFTWGRALLDTSFKQYQ